MKQPDVGALGLAAVVLVLLVQVAALLACLEAGPRPARPGARRRRRAARRQPGVHARHPGRGARRPRARWSPAPSARPCRSPSPRSTAAGAAALDGVRPVLALLAGLLVARVLRRHAVRRLEGVTGDVLGALVEVTTAVVLVAMSVQAGG